MVTVLFGDQKELGVLFPLKRQESCWEKHIRDYLCHILSKVGKENDKLSRDYINLLSAFFL